MTGVDNLSGTVISDGADDFFRLFESGADIDVVQWAANYHYFWTQQARLLRVAVCELPENEYEGLAEVTLALSEEFGSGDAEHARSNLLARFCCALGIDIATLPLPRDKVIRPVNDYLDAVRQSYQSSDLPRLLAAYCFVMSSTSSVHARMVEVLRTRGFDERQLAFFSAKRAGDGGREGGAHRLVLRLIKTAAQQTQFEECVAQMRKLWVAFWQAFLPHGQHASAPVLATTDAQAHQPYEL